MLINILIFLFVATQQQKQRRRKNKRKSNDGIKDEFPKSLIDGEIEFKFMKVFKKIIKRKKQRMLNFMYKQGFLFEKFKEPDKFKEMCKENGVSKTHKTVRNSKFNSKLKMAMNVNSFIDVETCYNYFNVWIRSV